MSAELESVGTTFIRYGSTEYSAQKWVSGEVISGENLDEKVKSVTIKISRPQLYHS